jgi:iron complex outermembrane recepter protein
VLNYAGPKTTISLTAALLLLSFRALAQTADLPPATGDPPAANRTLTEASSTPNASSGGELQQVVVTGYLLPRIGEGPQPVTTLDRNYIEKTGSQTIADVLQNLPSALANFNPANTAGFSFSPGGASVALKGLPPNDTLILVDGLRFPQSPFPQVTTGSTISYVDINAIPLAAVDRVEILNDGGSATYGTDAVAGVVNLILKDEYNGADVFNYFGISQRGDSETYHGSFVGGLTQKFSDTSKLSVIAAFDYYSAGPIMNSDRANTNPDYSLLSPKYPPHPVSPSTTGEFVDPSGNFYQVLPGTRGPFVTASDFAINQAPIPGFSEPYLQIIPRETRLGGLVKMAYDVTDWLKLYDSLIIQRNEELSSFSPNQGIYPPPFNPGVVVPAYNPYNPFGVPLLVNGLALNEFGPLRTDTTVTTLRNVAGATIQLPHGWFIDANVLYGESDGTETVNNMFTFNGMQAALNGTLPGHVGQFFNPFVDESITGANREFYGDKQLVTSIWEDNRTDIFQIHATAGGTLIELPAGALTVAGGFEYRSEDFIVNEDPNSKSGNLTAIQLPVGELTNGRRYIWSIFGEADIPIFGNQWSWPGMRNLDVVISERQDYYSDFGSAAKPKIAVRYKPLNDFTIRATYSEGFVAPSLPELFGSPLPGEAVVIDPKFPQLGFLTVLNSVRGNTNLKPENAYTYYVGGVWSPGSTDPEHSWWGWANGFSAYFNWFQIDQHNVIGTLFPQNIVDLGSSAPPGNFVVRGPNGIIDEIVGTYLNLGNQRNDGIEFGFNYTSKEYSWGKLELEFDASYIYNVSLRTVQGLNPNGTFFYRVFDETGTAEVGPDLKFIGSLFYSKTLFGTDTFRTGFTLHYVGSELDFINSANNTNPTATLDAPNYVHLIGNWTTLDWQISYKFGPPTEITPETPKPGYNKEGKKIVGEKAIAPEPEGPRWNWRNLLANTTVTFGINNVFDTAPPLSVDNIEANYDFGEANYIQRFFYFSIEKQF